MAVDNSKYTVIDKDGNIVARINPPPTVIGLIKDKKADKTWKDWLYLIYDFASNLSYEQKRWIAPNMTTTERNALTAENGMIIYNTTTNQFNFYENGSWVTK